MEVFNNSTLQKRQRNLRESSGDTEGKKKRTATLLDLDVIDCPICFHTLTIPIFQCKNGHIVCSTCSKKLSGKCATCSLLTLSRNRAMERVLELLGVPCPNAGCSESMSGAEISTHVKNCAFTQRPCPFSSCDVIFSFKDLYEHCVAKHCISDSMFECGTPVFIHPVSGKRVILKEQTTEREGEIVVVECLDTPQVRIFYASCIGPGTDKFSYEFKIYSSSGARLSFVSKLKRVREVSNGLPGGPAMSLLSSMCPDYKFYICIKRET